MDLFNDNINLVRSIVNRMNYGYLDKDDLFQAGLMGLFKATKRFKNNNGTKFQTFATYYIIGEIKEELRNNKLIKLSKEIYRIIKELKENDEISIEELSSKLGVSKENIMLAISYKEKIISLNKEENENELLDSISSIKQEHRVTINDLNESLSGKMKEIIYKKYFLGFTQTELAKELKISQSKISRIEKKSLDVLKKFYLDRNR